MSAPTAQIEPTSERPRHRLRIAAVSIAAVAAGAVPLAAHATGANPANGALASSGQMYRLEAQGYVAAACTPQGTLMIDAKTGRSVTVKAS